MHLDKKEIQKLANLAKLELTSEEVEEYQHQLKEVLDYVGKMQELNLATIEPSLTGVPTGEHQLRDDRPAASQPETIKQARELKDGYLISPAVFKK